MQENWLAAGCHLRASGERRPRQPRRIRDPHKDEKMAVIHKALDECSAEHPVFYEDEVDIHLNPKIGADWQLRGQQKRVVTPGQNENTIWPAHCTVARVKSATWAATAKFSAVLSLCWSTWKPLTGGRKQSRWSLITTLSIKAAKHSAGWKQIPSSG